MSSPQRQAVVVDLLDVEASCARAVLSAALQLFGPQDPVDVVLVLPGVEDPQDEHGALVSGLVVALVPDPAGLPEVLLDGVSAADARSPLVRVAATGEPVADARAVVMLGAAAERVWADAAPAPALDAGVLAEVEGQLARLAAERDRALTAAATARRDLRTARGLVDGTRLPVVVLLFQHRSYWGALATLWQALEARADVEVRVVALDSTADGRGESTADFLTAQGVTPLGPGQLRERLDEVDVVVLVDPYDEMRPQGLRVPDLVAAGVRLAAVPYGGNAIAGPLMDVLLWDLPLQQLAWRAYLASPVQERLFARHCRAGAGHVRVLGTPKADRVVQAARTGQLSPRAQELRDWAAGRPLVLWNPHFRVGDGGWSTFDRHLEPLLQRFGADPSMVLLLRPHFRLFPDLQRIGGPAARLEAAVRGFADQHENVRLDEEPDYLDALTACDAMLSDLSSLATELLPSGRPVLYLHRPDGPGTNEEGAHFDALDRADDWAGVAAFLDRLARGEDPQREARAAVVARDLALADGRAGERIADDLVASLRADLGLA